MEKTKEDDKGCWIWTGAKDGSGYGKFKGHEKVMTPHKFSYEEHKQSKVPIGKIIKHTCDQPLCVNPAHLELGTYSENAKERWARTGSKLPPEEVIARAIIKALPEVKNEQIKTALASLGLSPKSLPD